MPLRKLFTITRMGQAKRSKREGGSKKMQQEKERNMKTGFEGEEGVLLRQRVGGVELLTSDGEPKRTHPFQALLHLMAAHEHHCKAHNDRAVWLSSPVQHLAQQCAGNRIKNLC